MLSPFYNFELDQDNYDKKLKVYFYKVMQIYVTFCLFYSAKNDMRYTIYYVPF